ncbi:MAG: HDOD domain-containing protein [Gammaproteobacteria bacterium]|nr:HDOD domain-containing protein [Gammaproteobacteria bacterium]
MTQNPHSELLRKIPMLAGLPPWQIDVVADAVEPIVLEKGRTLVERGTDDGYTYFLTEGQVSLEPADGDCKTIDIGGESARTPVANLRPRILSVRALSYVRGIRLPDIVLSAAGCSGSTHDDDFRVESQEEEERRRIESKLRFQLYRDLKSDQAILPSLPDLALRIRRAIDDSKSTAREVANLIETDPAITAKLLKVSNSAFYAGLNAIETPAGAVVRLGMQTTRKLVMSFALKEVFRSKDPMVQKRMHVLWKHSAQIAALCFVLAGEVKGIEPEEALLVGLVHDIGAIAILNYIERYPELAVDEDSLEQSISDMRGELGAMILREWKFSPVVIAAARDAENWLRMHQGPADFTDLLIVAQVHERLRKQNTKGLPAMDRISAFKRVLGADATPEKSVEIMHAAKARIDEMRSMLRN